MVSSWLQLGSEKLHPIISCGWHEGVGGRASKLVPVNVVMHSLEGDQGLNLALADAAGLNEFSDAPMAGATDLPPEIAELIFGAQAS